MSQNKHLLIFILTSLLLSPSAFAEVLHWPAACSDGALVIKNRTSSDLSIWLQKFDSRLAAEDEYDLPASAVTEINLEPLASDESYSLLNFNASGALDLYYRCGGSDYPVNTLEGGALTFRRSDLEENKIWLQNLYAGENLFEVEFLDFSFQKISSQKFSLNAREGLTLVTGEGQKDWSYFRIAGQSRFSVFNLTTTGAEGPVLVSPQKTQVAAGAYFLVGPRSGVGDTFVVKIDNDRTIAEARSLVQSPKEKMLFARIEKGHQGFNRNFSKPEKSLWSWSTSEVTGFGDLGSTACNGAPQLVEDRIDGWLIDPGQICFWNYRVKKELTPLEVSTGNIK